MAVDDIGLGFIKVRFRRAFAGSTECTPHSDRFESCCARNKKEAHPKGELLYGGRYRTRTYDLPHVKRML